jgi:VanZ family protein
LAFGFGFTTQLAVQVFGLIAFSVVVEVAQLAVPGRHARLSDFVVDALSASIGAAAAVAVRRYTERGREASRP